MSASFYRPKKIADLRRPNYGDVDHEVALSLKHTMLAEKQKGHKMKGTFPKDVPIPDLTRPNFGDKDEEIFSTQKNILAAEIKHEAILKAEFYKP